MRKTGFSPLPRCLGLNSVWILDEQEWARHQDSEDWNAWDCKESLETTQYPAIAEGRNDPVG
jgi:hypothetical protein